MRSIPQVTTPCIRSLNRRTHVYIAQMGYSTCLNGTEGLSGAPSGGKTGRLALHGWAISANRIKGAQELKAAWWMWSSHARNGVGMPWSMILPTGAHH